MNRRRSTWLLLLVSFEPVAATVPSWLAGPPDTHEYADRAPLYRSVLDDVAEQCGVDATGDTLARKRLINAVNRAVEDQARGGRSSYRAMLRYLSVAGPDPVHCEFRLEATQIERTLGTLVAPSAAQRPSSDERTHDP